MSRGAAPAWRSRPDVVLGWAGTVAVVVSIYVAVVALGALVTGEAEPSLTLSVLATVVVAAVIGPVQRRCERLTSRLLHAEATTPYDALRQFADQVGAARDPAALPQRMARLLAEGTAASWAQVWVLVNDRLSLVATHPPDVQATATPPTIASPPSRSGGLRSVTVGHDGGPLGVLRVQERPGRPLTAVEERLFAGLAAQAGLALHAARLRAELLARHEQLSRRAIDLRVARDRLVAAQDQERRRLERDIHDGAQQQLVALGINLRLAQTLADRSPERAVQILRSQASAASASLETLGSLSRGVGPSVLREGGLLRAFRAVAEWSPVPVLVLGDGELELGQDLEEALYFCGLEAIQNSVKHAGASQVELRLRLDGGLVRLTVVDDGVGFTGTSGQGSGFANMRHRLASVGGEVDVRSTPGRGTTVQAMAPLRQAVPR